VFGKYALQTRVYHCNFILFRRAAIPSEVFHGCQQYFQKSYDLQVDLAL
jgi:hypothetical protein